jgi:RHS repeat-associated protein
MLAAKEQPGEVFPLAVFSCSLPKTRVWGSTFENQAFLRASGQLTSTLRWGCGYIYGGTASDSLDQRFYASSYGRFTTADPTARNISFQDPQTWNLYAYTNGDPVNSNDPTGLCSAFFAGITQEYDESSAFTRIANAAGAQQAYGYAGLDAGNSILSIARQDSLAQQAIGVALASLNQVLANNTGKVDVVAFSGGASAFSGAYNLLSVADQQRIGNIVYVSPGAAGEIATNSTTSVVLGTGFADWGATMGTSVPPGTPTTQTQCAHTDFACLVNSAQSQFKPIQDNGACWSPGMPTSSMKGGSRSNGSAGSSSIQNMLNTLSGWVGSISTTTRFWSDTVFRPERN